MKIQDFKEWATSKGWIEVVADPDASTFVSPNGNIVYINTNDDEVICEVADGKLYEVEP